MQTFNEFQSELLARYAATIPNSSTPRRHVIEAMYEEHKKRFCKFSVDLLDKKYCTELRRQYEPMGFTFDTRRHNRFQTWTIISHQDGAKAEELRAKFAAEGYETDYE